MPCQEPAERAAQAGAVASSAPRAVGAGCAGALMLRRARASGPELPDEPAHSCVRCVRRCEVQQGQACPWAVEPVAGGAVAEGAWWFVAWPPAAGAGPALSSVGREGARSLLPNEFLSQMKSLARSRWLCVWVKYLVIQLSPLSFC